MMKNKKVNNSAFTLIELLIVMAIIAVLSGISIFALQGARTSGRDARRKADLENIMSAMTLYKADCGQYPSFASLPSGALQSASGTDGCSASNTYLQDVPEDPSGGSYCYNRITATQACVCANLENDPATTEICTGCGSCDYRVLSQ